MTNYEKKEEKVMEKIIATIEKLDRDLDMIDEQKSDNKKHHFKKWLEEKKALHEIKRLLNEISKYDKYDEKEMEKAKKFIGELEE